VHARGLPAASYLDPARAAIERERIFDRSWQFVCHASDLPAPGTAIRFDCAARSSVVMRGSDGALHGFLNSCRHRGSRLIDGDAHTGLAFCVESRLRCPYHGWTYDQTGALVALPEPQRVADFDAELTALRPVHVEQWRGLVFIAVEPPVLSLADALEPAVPAQVAEGSSNLRRLGEPRTYAIQADWKLASEHLLDLSHRVVARPTVKPQLFDVATFTACGPLVVRATGAVAGMAAATPWPVRAYAQWLPEGAPRTAEILFAWPNLLLQFAPDQLAVIQVLPGPTGSCQLREVAYGTPVASRELRLVRYAHARVRRSARAQDSRILERVQHGLASAGAAAGGGPIASSEVGLQWFVECLRAHTTASAGIKPVRQRRLRKPALAIP
jgi:phenylpropionate dioxygenase-like ring-hydroxylating dioxygenase large terminal subunit